MAVFPSRKYYSPGTPRTFAMKYRAAMAKHPFLLFGLPFMAVIVAGSFVLTPATAIRYERHDRKVRQMTKEEELGIGKAGRRVDMKEEYYVRCGSSSYLWSQQTNLRAMARFQRLAAKDLDNWEQRRVKRLPGESDGKL